MKRTRLKRLLIMCLTIMLSVSILPTGIFAAGTDAQSSDVVTDDISGRGDAAIDVKTDSVKSENDQTSTVESDIGDGDAVGQDGKKSGDGNLDADTSFDPDAEDKLTKGNESKEKSDSTSLEVKFDDYSLPMQETYSMRADHQITMVVTASMPSTAAEKTITIDIPTGWAIMSCSALDSDELPVIDLKKANIMDPHLNDAIVGKIDVDDIYIDQLKKLTLEPVTSAGIASAYGTVTGNTWDSQVLQGYEGVTYARTLGGRLTYTLSDNAQNMQLTIHLLPQSYLFSREGNDTTEVMPPVVTTLSVKKDGEEAEVKELSTDNKVIATHIPRVTERAATPDKYNEIVPVNDDRVHLARIEGAISQWNGTTNNSTWYSLADEYTYTITYPPGVFYSEDQSGGFDSQGRLYKQVIPEGSEITISEDSVNGGGTVTIKGTNYTLKHNGTDFRLYFDAKGYNENVNNFHPGCEKVWAKDNDPETLTITGKAEFKRLGTTATTDNINWKRTIYRPADGDSYAITIGKTDIVRRDLVDDFGLDQYDIKLAHTSLESWFEYEDVPFHFVNQDNKLGITGFRMVGKDIKDIEIKTFYADGRPGRTITKAGPYGTSFPPSDTNGSYMISGEEIGLNPGEYISEINLRADIDQKTYGTGNLGCGIGFIGQFLQGRDDEEKAGKVDVSIVYYEDGQYDNTPAKSRIATDETGKPLDVTGYAAVTVGMNETGCGSCPTTVSMSQDGINASNPTWYPNQIIYIQSTLQSSFVWHQQDTLIDPVITIALPEGIELNTSSVEGQSLAGNHQDSSWFDLKPGNVRQIEVDGVTWNCYDYSPVNPLDMVASECRTNVGDYGGTVTVEETMMRVRFDAYVSSTCNPYALDVADCVLWYIGDNVKSGNGGTPAISKDVDNRMGRGPEAIAAHGSKQFYIKPLIGLVTDLAIRADESPEADWMTWAGGDNTIANVHEGQPAQVRLSYESTAASDNFNDSVFYLPIPKKDAVYDYLNNVELASPMDVTDLRTFGFTANLTGPVTMKGGATKWTTYYAVSAKSAETIYDSTDPDSDEWEPVSPRGTDTWLTEEEIINSSDVDWSDVVMVKFHADDPIPPGEKGEALFTMDIDPDAEFGTYDYWRSYGKARLGNTKDQWMYTPVIAATPTSATLLGQIFIDDNVNAAFDEDSEQGYGTNFTAVLSKDDGAVAPMEATVGSDGSVKILDSKGRQIYLREGDYTLTVTKSAEEKVYDYEGIESETNSSADKWYNDIKNNNVSGNTATYKFTVDKSGEVVGGSFIPAVYYAGVGLAQMNGFSFFKLGEVEGNDGNVTNEPLAGAKFVLYTDADCTTAATRLGTAYEATSDSDGKVEFKDVTSGIYYMKETSLPSGTEGTYFANNTTYKVTVSNTDPVLTITRTVADPDTGDMTEDANGYSIINRQKTSFNGIKIWNDGDDENRPTKIVIRIIVKAGNEVTEIAKTITTGEPGEGEIKATVNDDGTWSFTVDELRKFSDGMAIVYEIASESALNSDGSLRDDYTAKIDGDAENGFEITNTKIIDIPVEKKWKDGDGTNRPASITVQLLANGNEVADKTLTLNSGNSWKDTFTDLPKYDDSKKEIKYTIDEVSVTGYMSNITGSETAGYVITNIEKTEATVKKVWNDNEDNAKKRPASLTVTLMQSVGSAKPTAVKDDQGQDVTVTLKEDNSWKDTVSDLPKYDAGNNEITYSWSEEALPDGYELTENSKEGTVTTLTNTYVPHTVKVTKTFTGIDKDSLPKETFKITANYKEYSKSAGAQGTAKRKDLKLTDTEGLEVSADGLVFTWTIDNVCVGTEFKATEDSAGLAATGYKVESTVAASDTAAAGTPAEIAAGTDPEGTIEKVPMSDDAHIDFVNKYMHSDLYIFKTLPEYILQNKDKEEFVYASFAFRIEGFNEAGTKIYDNVKGIEFNSQSEVEGKAFIGKIPPEIVEVKVTEIGMSDYKPEGDNPVTATVTTDADGNTVFEAKFKNIKDGKSYESGVVNRYKRDGDSYDKGANEIPAQQGDAQSGEPQY